MSFQLGCAIWAYKGWLGDFYPKGSPAGQLLKLYCDRFSTVECNATFYSIPSPETVAKWGETVPDDFRFCPKFPKIITHQGVLKPHINEALDFIQLMQILGQNLGPLFVQLPPSYGPSNLNDLAQFLKGLPTDLVKIAVELRHPDWFKPPFHSNVTGLLKSLKVGQVLLDSRPMYEVEGDPQKHSQRRKPRVPLIPQLTADFSIVRFISHPQQKENERFMEDWLLPLEEWTKAEREIYFFMHCPVEEHSPDHAKFFYDKLRAIPLDLPSLPWENIAKPPAQLDLFSL